MAIETGIIIAKGVDVGAEINGKLGKTENAASATKATQDANGNVIADTYATKTEIEGFVETWSSADQSVMSEKGDLYGNLYLKGSTGVAELAAGGATGKAHVYISGANDADSTPSITFSSWNVADDTTYSALSCSPDTVELQYFENNETVAWISVGKENGVSFQDKTAGYVKLSDLALKSSVPDTSTLIPKTDSTSGWSWESTSSGVSISCDQKNLSLSSETFELRSSDSDSSAIVSLRITGDHEGINGPSTYYPLGIPQTTITKDTPDITYFEDPDTSLDIPDSDIGITWIRTIYLATPPSSVFLDSGWVWDGGIAPDLATVMAITAFWHGNGGFVVPHVKA